LQKVSHLRESVLMLEYKSKKFAWSPKWFILNPENIEIYKDDKVILQFKLTSYYYYYDYDYYDYYFALIIITIINIIFI
jgi:hypothetical protein